MPLIQSVDKKLKDDGQQKQAVEQQLSQIRLRPAPQAQEYCPTPSYRHIDDAHDQHEGIETVLWQTKAQAQPVEVANGCDQCLIDKVFVITQHQIDKGNTFCGEPAHLIRINLDELGTEGFSNVE